MKIKNYVIFTTLLFSISTFISCINNKVLWVNPADQMNKNKKIDRVIKDWTRHVQLHEKWATTIDVDVVFLSWEVRKRLLEERIANERINPGKADALRKREQELFNGYVVFYVALFTTKDDWDNLDEEKPSWNIFFQNEKKLLFPHYDIEKIEMDDALRFAYFPAITNWKTVYKVRYLRKSEDGDILSANPDSIGLLFKGYLGETLLKWNIRGK